MKKRKIQTYCKYMLILFLFNILIISSAYSLGGAVKAGDVEVDGVVKQGNVAGNVKVGNLNLGGKVNTDTPSLDGKINTDTSSLGGKVNTDTSTLHGKVKAACCELKINPGVCLAIVKQESNFKPRAYNPEKTVANAQSYGLAQVLCGPGTFINPKKFPIKRCTDLYDPIIALRAMQKTLQYIEQHAAKKGVSKTELRPKHYFGGYNCGPGKFRTCTTASRHLRWYKELPMDDCNGTALLNESNYLNNNSYNPNSHLYNPQDPNSPSLTDATNRDNSSENRGYVPGNRDYAPGNGGRGSGGGGKGVLPFLNDLANDYLDYARNPSEDAYDRNDGFATKNPTRDAYDPGKSIVKCDGNYNPVCATMEDDSKKTFFNECFAKNNENVKSFEKEKCTARCTEEYNPVCALLKNGKNSTFPNKCFAMNDENVVKIKDDMCEDKKAACANINLPVCATLKDGTTITYTNACFAEKDEDLKHYIQGSCEENDGDDVANPLNPDNLDCPDISVDNIGQFINAYITQIESFETFYSRYISHLKHIRRELELQLEKCDAMRKIVKNADYLQCQEELSVIAKLVNGEDVANPCNIEINKIIIIDPGRGGSDKGEEKEGIVEKNINLQMAKTLKEKLSEYGFNVYLTRDSDVDIGLTDRINFAKGKNPLLMVSIHNDVGEASGLKVIYGKHTGAKELATNIHSHLLRRLSLPDKGKPYFEETNSDFDNLFEITSFPNVIVIPSDVENDVKRLKESNFMTLAATAIYQGIIETTFANVFGDLLSQSDPKTHSNDFIALPTAKFDALEEALATCITPSVCDEAIETSCSGEDEKTCQTGKQKPLQLCSMCTVLECNRGSQCEARESHSRTDYSKDGLSALPNTHCEHYLGESESCNLGFSNDDDIGIYKCNDEYCDIYTEKGFNLEVVPSLAKECHQNIANLIDTCVIDNGIKSHGVTYYLDRTKYLIEKYEKNISPSISLAKEALKDMRSKHDSAVSQGLSQELLIDLLKELNLVGNSFKEDAVGDFQLVASELVYLFRDDLFQTDVKENGKGHKYTVNKYKIGISTHTSGGSYISSFDKPTESLWEDVCLLVNGPEFVTKYISNEDRNVVNGNIGLSNSNSDNEKYLFQLIQDDLSQFISTSIQQHSQLIDSKDYATTIIAQQTAGCSLNAGKCAVSILQTSITDHNYDQWTSSGFNYVNDLAKLDPKTLFVKNCELQYNTGDPYSRGQYDQSEISNKDIVQSKHNGQSKICEESCQTCLGTRESHCHAHRGVCICEESADLWTSIDEKCTETAKIDEKAFTQCCMELFKLLSKPDEMDPPLNKPNKCEYDIAQSFSLSIDYCQTKTSETGLCCSYAFDEMPISLGCLKKHFSNVDDDNDGENDEDPIDGIDNDKDGKTDEDGGDFISSLEEENALDTLSVDFEILRHNVTASVFYADDDNIKVVTNVINEGNKEFEGDLTLFLDVHSECECPQCSDDTSCPCTCKTDSKEINSYSIHSLSEEESVTFESRKINLFNNLENSTIQIKATIRDKNGKTAQWKSELYYIIPKGSISISDAYFINRNEEPVLSAYPFEEVTGLIKGSFNYVPVKASLSLVDNENDFISSTTNEFSFDLVSEEIILKTKPIHFTSSDIDSIKHINLQITDHLDNTIFNEIFSEQPLPKPTCSGTIVTSWCEDQKTSFRLSYPAAFLSIENPDLIIDKVEFINADGMILETNNIKDNDLALALIHIHNIATVPFEGDVITSVSYHKEGSIDKSENQILIDLKPGESTIISSELILFSQDRPISIHIVAIDNNDIVWFDKDLDNIFLPKQSQLETSEVDEPFSNRVNIDTQVEFGVCNLYIRCDQCLPSCQLYINEGTCEVRPTLCDCTCESTL